MKLSYFFGLYILMLAALPFPEYFAYGPSSPTWKCFLFMFGHAGIMHWLMNGIGWLMMWKIATPGRTFVAYLFSACAVLFLPADENILGWSCVIYYYLGLCLAHMPHARRWKVFLLTFIGFFIPHIAASVHLALLAAGWIGRKMEQAWKKTL